MVTALARREPEAEAVALFNKLNKSLAVGIPEFARAYDVILRHRPLLLAMQALLSQRPQIETPEGRRFAFHRRRFRIEATKINNVTQLPTWSWWAKQYSDSVGYSVRQIRRIMFDEKVRMKPIKECGWSISDHNHMIRAVTLLMDLTSAHEARADTTRLFSEAKDLIHDVDPDLFTQPYRPLVELKPARRKRRVTRTN